MSNDRSYQRRVLPAALAVASLALCATTHAITIAHWRFEEGPIGSPTTTPILDSSGNGHHGTPIGGITYANNTPNSTLPRTSAANNTTLHFDGATTTRVFIEDDPDIGIDQVFHPGGSTSLHLPQSIQQNVSKNYRDGRHSDQ